MAWGIHLGPSFLSASLVFSIPAAMDLALTYPLSPPPLLSSHSSPLRETLSPEGKSRQGREIQLPGTFTGQL